MIASKFNGSNHLEERESVPRHTEKPIMGCKLDPIVPVAIFPKFIRLRFNSSCLASQR